MSSDPIGVPYRAQTRVAKYHDGTTDREPDEIVEIDHGWFDADGTPVTDPARIAELTARQAQRDQEQE